MMLLGGGTVWGSVIGAILMTWVINGFSQRPAVQRGHLLGHHDPAPHLPACRAGPAARPAGPSQGPAQAGEARRSRPSAWWRPKRTIQPGQCTTSVGMPLAVSPEVASCLGSGDRHDGTGGRLPAAASRQPDASGRPCFSVEDLSVHFGGLKAVDEVSLEVHEGEIVALIGPNGAGKTTLFNAVSRLQKLTGGSVEFAGTGRHQDVDGQHRSPGHGPNLPEPAHLREHDRARERAGGLPPARALGAVGRRAGASSPAPRREGFPGAGHAGPGRGGARGQGLPAGRQPALWVAAPGGDRPGARL